MEGNAIARSHCILLIRAKTFFDEYLYSTIYTSVFYHQTLYIEEDPHQGSKRICNMLTLY